MRGAAPGAKTYWGRNGKWTDGGRLGNKEGIDSMPSVRQERTLNVQI